VFLVRVPSYAISKGAAAPSKEFTKFEGTEGCAQAPSHMLAHSGPEWLCQKRSPQAALETGPQGCLMIPIRGEILRFSKALICLGPDVLEWRDLRFVSFW
jgi:hypothetical protein